MPMPSSTRFAGGIRAKIIRSIAVTVVAAQQGCGGDGVGPGPTSRFDPCEIRAAYAFGSSTSGTLTIEDCSLADGSYVDYYNVVLSSDVYTFDMTTAGFPAFLVLFSADGSPLAVHNDLGTTPDTAIKAIVPPGTYVIGAGSMPGITGPYVLKSAPALPDVGKCEVVFVTKGSHTTQTLSDTDCAANNSHADEYYIYLAPGKPVTVTMRSSAFDSSLEMYDRLNNLVASNNNINATTTDAQFTFNARLPGFYRLAARATSLDAAGSYTLSVQ
jgi:hypothetical protein